jgi:putative membrane protein insertion efficiency factor
MRRILILPIHFYKVFISSWLPFACRFTPTCSEYAMEALKKYGIMKGTWLSAKRIFRCHPWGKCGHDPVP